MEETNKTFRADLEASYKSFDEMIQEKDTSEYCIFPVKNYDLYSFYEKQRDMFWVTQEIDFSQDRHSWDTLPENDRTF